jgi:hypothetical protein
MAGHKLRYDSPTERSLDCSGQVNVTAPFWLIQRLGNRVFRKVTASLRMCTRPESYCKITLSFSSSNWDIRYISYRTRKVAGSIPEEVNFKYLFLPAALGPGVYSVSNRNEYRKHKNNNVYGE